MGGWGSGRDSYATTPNVEECHTLDVNAFTELVDHPGAFGPYAWYDNGGNGDKVAEIGVRALPVDDASVERATHLRVEYTVTDNRTDETTDHAYPIALNYTACNFGGSRPWFRCPMVGCGTRIGKLYRPLNGQIFACRECHELGYRSCRESGDEVKQAERRYRRAYAKIDSNNRRPHPNSTDYPYPPGRPAGMHRETYETHLTKLRDAYHEWQDASLTELHALAESVGVEVPPG
ncbi:hypothetical protein [Halomarina ordinaria]|uniref:Uncharacterized protein n=1 Tax=Halomarina ordinaria TaxID=3033939 RepID=A0ABD5U9V3_9EURY|nr:hypothetical protein [Halomarina sp. PSRA2]